eukprot:TRINITY_DN11659_c0_g1::TRINITY_DN11659_c0_g1_i1::g.17466::m.17466 TRINITY_DN11659_c0_g1::TRINITY_DN11659_c0_g1_i1::g.17466  ORF type:complete len:179 (+),score=-7.82,sp/Q63042/ALR_RAT/46.60/4e-31,Evr1_Alr/PF04777.8/1.3e-28,Med27/PF11571.3/0.011 TRINITY_DN11659_c0_g1_i1:75-611(+)
MRFLLASSQQPPSKIRVSEWRFEHPNTNSVKLSPLPAVEAPAQLLLGFPPDKDTLGRSTWTLLHSIAAYFPENPSPAQQQDFLSFINSFAKLYPCRQCSQNFQTLLQQFPPNAWLSSRHDLCQWMCKVHNDVNVRLGKPSFSCDDVDTRWRLINPSVLTGVNSNKCPNRICSPSTERT